jgi:LemA protein
VWYNFNRKDDLMKKGTIVLIVILAIIIFGGLYAVSTNNKFVGLRETVDKEAANIDVALERRADLIPNLVSTVKGYMKHEESIIDSITEARQNLVNAGSLEEKAEANNKLNSALNALMVIVENYPDLKASENFIQLQDELAGTENRIAVARKNYNDAATNYNKAIQMFPGSIIANLKKYEKVNYFEADESKKEVPTVDFD